MAEIELERLTKVFDGGVTAVDDVSLRDRRRRVRRPRRPVRLRQVDAAAHDRRARGHDRRDRAHRRDGRHRPGAAQRDVAMVFQTYALYPHMSVRQNIGYGLKVRRMPKAEARRRVDEVAELLGLEELLDRRPAQLSGGQRQRVAMGRAIVARAAGVPDGRAALEPRRQAPRRHARLARAAARPARRDHGLRHPRPDRGDDARPPRRGHARRAHPAGGHAAAALPRAGRPVRGRLHRHAGDEPRRGARRGRRRQLRPATAWRSTRPGGRRRAPATSCWASGPRRSRKRPSRPGCRPSTRPSPCSRSSARTRMSSSPSTPCRPAARPRPATRPGCSRTAETLFTARVDPRTTARVGDAVRLAVDPARFHFFDPETGRSLVASSDTQPRRPSSLLRRVDSRRLAGT